MWLFHNPCLLSEKKKEQIQIWPTFSPNFILKGWKKEKTNETGCDPLSSVANANGPGTERISTPKMAGVFEVEVDGVEHDHGLEHHDVPSQVRARGAAPRRNEQIQRIGVRLCPGANSRLGSLCQPRLTGFQPGGSGSPPFSHLLPGGGAGFRWSASSTGRKWPCSGRQDHSSREKRSHSHFTDAKLASRPNVQIL